MKNTKRSFACGGLCSIILSLALYAQPFTPDIEQSERTRILVLASAHLMETFPDTFDHQWLDTVIEELYRFSPDIIGVESLPPNILHYMDMDSDRYEMVVRIFGARRIELGKELQGLLGMAWTECVLGADSLLARAEIEALHIKERLRLIQLLLASYDGVNAVLHWAYLSEDYRASIPETDLPVRAAEYLQNNLRSRNETYSVGVRLARLLGHSHIASIDDHQDSDIIMDIFEELSTQLRASEEFQRYLEQLQQERGGDDRMNQESIAEGDLYSLYKSWNSPEYLDKNMEQFKVFFRTKLPNGWDRRRMAQREIRDLNIASNIRRASAYFPGGKMLIIIGSSHKPFLESYLSRLLDVELVQFHELAGLQ